MSEQEPYVTTHQRDAEPVSYWHLHAGARLDEQCLGAYQRREDAARAATEGKAQQILLESQLDQAACQTLLAEGKQARQVTRPPTIQDRVT